MCLNNWSDCTFAVNKAVCDRGKNMYTSISFVSVCSELSKPLLPVGRAGILISEILHLLCKHMVSNA